MPNPLALTELYTLMLQRLLTPQVFADWARRSYGAPPGQSAEEQVAWVAKYCEPHPLDRVRVLAFDRYLLRSGLKDADLTRTMVALRNVFARNAKMPTLALGLPRSLLAEAVGRLAARHRAQPCRSSGRTIV